MTMLHIDLCCGLGGWQAPFKSDDSWRSVGIDIRPDLNPDVVADVRQLPLSACEPKLVTGSPPCPQFSTAPNKPFALRNPDFSVWNGVVKAILDLNPQYYVIENVAGLVHWHGPPQKRAGPYYLWGHFPPFDPGRVPKKSVTFSTGSSNVSNNPTAHKIPYTIANGLKLAIEKWG